MHRQPRPHGALGVIELSDWRSPKGHQCVTDELVQGPSLAEHLGRQHLEDLVQDRSDFPGPEGLRHRREACQVREQHGHLAFIDGECASIALGAEQVTHNVGSAVPGKALTQGALALEVLSHLGLLDGRCGHSAQER